MQTAAYVGFRTRGLAGAAASFIGFGFPAFVLMMTLSLLYARTHTLPVVVSAFQGLEAIIVAIVANATVLFGRTTLKEWRGTTIALVAAILFGFGVNPIAVILSASLMGLVLKLKPYARRSGNGSTIVRCQSGLLILLAIAGIGFIVLFLVRRRLFDLAALMSVVDLFAFGGGFASIPLMFHEIVEVRGWIDGPTFLNGIVLGQITPGPIVITSTFIGCIVHGPLGGFIATIGIFLPSFLMVIWTAPYFDKLLSSSYFTAATGGVLCSFVGLLFTVTFRFGLNVQWDKARTLLACSALVALLVKVDILWVVLAGAIISIVMI